MDAGLRRHAPGKGMCSTWWAQQPATVCSRAGSPCEQPMQAGGTARPSAARGWGHAVPAGLTREESRQGAAGSLKVCTRDRCGGCSKRGRIGPGDQCATHRLAQQQPLAATFFVGERCPADMSAAVQVLPGTVVWTHNA